MVKLLSLEVSNFKRLDLRIPLSFRDGITLISGPNESGKSTILDAIMFALFSRTVRPKARPKDEDILAYGTNKASIRLSFTLGDRSFVAERRIYRTRPNEATLYERLPDGSLKVIATKVNAVNNEIHTLLGGLTYDELVASNIVAQKELDRLVRQTKSERITIINAFLNLESFNQALDKMVEERKEIGVHFPAEAEKVNSLRYELESLGAKKKEFDETERKLKDIEKKTQDARLTFGETHEHLEMLEGYREAFTKRIQLEQEIKTKTELLMSLRTQLADLEVKSQILSSVEAELKSCDDLEELRPRIQDVIEKTKSLESLQIGLAVREQPLAVVLASLKKEEQELQQHQGASGVQQVIALRKVARTTMAVGLAAILGAVILTAIGGLPFIALTALGFGFLIYSTRQGDRATSLEAEHRDYLAKLEVLKASKRAYGNQQAEFTSLRAKAKENENELQQALLGLGRYSQSAEIGPGRDPVPVAKEIARRFEAEVSKRKLLVSKAETLRSDIVRKAMLEKEAGTAADGVEGLQKQHDTILLPELPHGLVYREELLDQTRQEDQKLRESIVTNEEAIRNAGESIAKLRKFIEERNGLPKQTEEQEKVVKQLESRLRIISEAKTGIEKTAEALRTRVRPNVERYMGLFLPAVTMDRYKAVQLDDDYNLSVYDPEAGEFRPRDIFSGGTEDQFLFIMRLAFALALIPAAKGTRPEFMFLDEPLASSDEFRRSGILNLLKTELIQYFKQIFLVSHVQGLEQDVDHIIRLETGRVVEEI